jgi:energy-coupling factor transporter ATP-binding protein EcfA2
LINAWIFYKRLEKSPLGQHFEFYPADYQVIFQLLVYFYKDYVNAERFGMDLRKGILLSGPVGCGKTSMMFLMRYLLTKDDQYIVKDCRAIGMGIYQGKDIRSLRNIPATHITPIRQICVLKPIVLMTWVWNQIITTSAMRPM